MENKHPVLTTDTIAAIATAHGVGAIAVIRLSGADSLLIISNVFKPASKNFNITTVQSHTAHFGYIIYNNMVIDEVLLTVFIAPASYTGENTVEISCHGSVYIQETILQLLVQHGARLAKPGEFTMRAFLNGKLDLSQAEAVADLIASSSEASRRIAMQQMRGGFSDELKLLRTNLLGFISLIELELDFSEEDVQFADRTQLQNLISQIGEHINRMKNSFQLGNVIKNGIPVAIAGEPNVGKSTLLNALLNDEKALVSEIAGTTRDAIEDTITLNGILFRFIDTAGIRHTTDVVENMGIERTLQKIEKAEVIIYITDTDNPVNQEKFQELYLKHSHKKWIVVYNKSDLQNPVNLNTKGYPQTVPVLHVSAKYKNNIQLLINELVNAVQLAKIDNNEIVITNLRHYQALQNAWQAIERVNYGIQTGISTDFLAQDIRQVLHFIGELTGEFTTDEILGNIFKNFCIGK